MYNLVPNNQIFGVIMNTNTKSNISSFLIFLLLIFFCISIQNSYSQSVVDPKGSIVVKDFVWGAGGRGQAAILKEITLKNTSTKEYRNIEIELELYSNNQTPQGSLRGTIKETLPPGSEKTFHNVKFGYMNSELNKSTARVVRAEEIERGTPTRPSSLLLVKDWKFSGGRYGTEAILKYITIENRSSTNYKDIKIKLSNLGVSGPKVGIEGYTSFVVIHDVIPAKSARTFRDINIGFRHPDAIRYNIEVMNAEKISAKEMRIKLAEKQKEEAASTGKDQTKYTVVKEENKSSLAERYKKELEAQNKSEVSGTEGAMGEQPVEQITSEKEEKVVAGEAKPEDNASETTGEETGAAVAIKQGEEPVAEKEVPLPKYDIVVKSFKWGSGVPGTEGTIKNLTLENKSSINYTRIRLLVEFYSSTDIPLGSNDLFIYDNLLAGETKTFRNLNIGMIQVLPEQRNIKITVKDAEAFNR